MPVRGYPNCLQVVFFTHRNSNTLSKFTRQVVMPHLTLSARLRNMIMAKFSGTLVIIGNTSFLDNVLLVRNSDLATATSFLQNRGLSSGVVVITGTRVTINTTPAI